MLRNKKHLREEVRSLSKANDVYAFRDITLRILFHISIVSMASYAWDKEYILLFAALSAVHFISYSFLGLAGISHELSHRNVFTSKFLNKFFFRFFCILSWNNFYFFEISHPIHHRKTLEVSDLEANSKKGMWVKDIIFSLSFDFPSFFNKLRIYFLNTLGLFPKGLPAIIENDESKKTGIVNASRAIIGFHAAFAFLAMIAKREELIILVTLAPFFITLPNKILASAQHFGVSDKFESQNYFYNSRTVILSKTLSFFYANMNYHVEHHYFPSVPYYNLPKLHNLIKIDHSYPYISYGLWGLTKDMKNIGYFSKPAIN